MCKAVFDKKKLSRSLKTLGRYRLRYNLRRYLGCIQAKLIGGGGSILKYPPQRKNFENTPLKISGKIFEKQGKTQKIRLILLNLALIKLN